MNHNTLRLGAVADRAAARREERAVARAIAAAEEVDVLDDEELGSAASAAG